jgi:hypothetical protein
MAWTTADEVVNAWIGNDAPTNLALVGVWVDKAERLLRSKIPDLQGRMDAGSSVEPDLAGNVTDVVVAMVQRVFRNPEGVRQRQEGTGPFTGSVTYGGDQPGALWVTDSEVALLSAAGASKGAFTIDMIPSSSPFSGSYVSPLNAWEIG